MAKKVTSKADQMSMAKEYEEHILGLTDLINEAERGAMLERQDYRGRSTTQMKVGGLTPSKRGPAGSNGTFFANLFSCGVDNESEDVEFVNDSFEDEPFMRCASPKGKADSSVNRNPFQCNRHVVKEFSTEEKEDGQVHKNLHLHNSKIYFLKNEVKIQRTPRLNVETLPDEKLKKASEKMKNMIRRRSKTNSPSENDEAEMIGKNIEIKTDPSPTHNRGDGGGTGGDDTPSQSRLRRILASTKKAANATATEQNPQHTAPKISTSIPLQKDRSRSTNENQGKGLFARISSLRKRDSKQNPVTPTNAEAAKTEKSPKLFSLPMPIQSKKSQSNIDKASVTQQVQQREPQKQQQDDVEAPLPARYEHLLSRLQEDVAQLQQKAKSDNLELKEKRLRLKSEEYKEIARELLEKAKATIIADPIEGENFAQKAHSYAKEARCMRDQADLARIERERFHPGIRAEIPLLHSPTVSTDPSTDNSANSIEEDTPFMTRVSREEFQRRLNTVALFSPKDIKGTFLCGNATKDVVDTTKEAEQLINSMAATKITQGADFFPHAKYEGSRHRSSSVSTLSDVGRNRKPKLRSSLKKAVASPTKAIRNKFSEGMKKVGSPKSPKKKAFKKVRMSDPVMTRQIYFSEDDEIGMQY